MSASEQPILLPLRAVPGSLISFEALLVLYMFAGIYKGDPRFAAVPVDLTGMFFALSVMVGSFIIVPNPIHRKSMPVVFAMICLVAWLLFSLIWSPSRIYGPGESVRNGDPGALGGHRRRGDHRPGSRSGCVVCSPWCCCSRSGLRSSAC